MCLKTTKKFINEWNFDIECNLLWIFNVGNQNTKCFKLSQRIYNFILYKITENLKKIYYNLPGKIPRHVEALKNLSILECLIFPMLRWGYMWHKSAHFQTWSLSLMISRMPDVSELEMYKKKGTYTPTRKWARIFLMQGRVKLILRDFCNFGTQFFSLHKTTHRWYGNLLWRVIYFQK